MSDGTIKIGVDIDEKQFSKELNSLQKQSEKAAGGISNAFKGFSKTIAGTTTVLSGLGLAVAKVGKDFEAQMSKVEAISGATADEMEKLRKKAEEMGRSTKFSAKQSAEALEYMALAGFKTEDMLNSLDGVMNLAAASGEDLGFSANVVTKTLSAFGLAAEESTRVADVLAATSSNASTDVRMLSEAFKYVAPVAGALNYTIEDTAFALGLMANAGVDASQAGTSLRSILSNLTSESKPVVAVLTELGITTTDTAGNMLPLDDVLKQLRESFSDLTEVQKAQYAKTLAGAEGMSGLLAIVNSAEADFNKLSDAINGSTGTAEEMATVMQDNLQGKLTTLKSQLEGLAINVYNYLEEPFKKAADVASKALKVLSDNIHIVVPVIGTLTAAFLAYKAALGVQSLISGVSNAMKMLNSITKLMTISQGALNLVMNANPYVLAATLILGIVTALVTLWNKNEAFREAIKKIWADIKETISNVTDAIKSFFTEKIPEAFNSLMNMFKELPGKMVEVGKNIVKGLWSGIKNTGNWLKNKMKGFADGVVNNVKSFFGIHSPSKRFEDEIGVMLVRGEVAGVEKEADNLVAALVSPYYTASKELDSKSNIFSETILNIVSESVDKAKKTSNSFKEVGKNIVNSLSEGINKNKKNIINTASGAIDDLLKQNIDQIEKNGKKLIEAEKKKADLEYQTLKKISKEKAAEYKAAAEEQIRAYTESVNEETKNKKDSLKNTADELMGVFKDSIEKSADEMDSLINGRISDLTNQYQSKFDNIISQQESLTRTLAGGDLFGFKTDDENKTKVIIEDLDKTIDKLEEYDKAISALKEKNISDAILGQLAKYNTDEALQITQKLLRMSDQEFTELNKKWEQKQELAKQVASNFYKEQMDLLQTEFNQKLTDTIDKLPEELENIGIMTIQGFIDGINSKKENALKETEEFANSVLDIMQKTMDIHSPSKKTEWFGKMFDKGLIVGIKKGEKDIIKTINGMNFLDAFSEKIPQLQASINAATRSMLPTGSVNTMSNSTKNITNNQGDFILRIDNFNAKDKMDISTLLTEASFYQKQRNNAIGVTR